MADNDRPLPLGLLCKRCKKQPRFDTDTLCQACIDQLWLARRERMAKKNRSKSMKRERANEQEKKKKAKKKRQAELVAKAKEFLATLTPEQQDALQQTGDPQIAKPSDLYVRERTINL